MHRCSDKADLCSVSCKTLSNLSIHADNISLVANAQGGAAVLRVMARHPNDPNLQWLACSALWNISQNNDQRIVIGDLGGVQAIVATLVQHFNSPLVQETAIGALANISVAAKYKSAVAGHIKLVYAAMDRHLAKHQVQTSACGLITNLAHSEEIASVLGNTHAVERVMRAMRRYPEKCHLQRNASAALSNLSGSDDNIPRLIRNQSVECLYKALKNFESLTNVTTLASRALRNIGIQDHECCTTSLHLAARQYGNGFQLLMTDLLAKSQVNIDIQDANGNSVLHHAARNAYTYRITWLVMRGADPTLTNLRGLSPLDLAAQRMDSNKLMKAFQQGADNLYKVRKDHLLAIRCVTPAEFYDDLDELILLFLNPAEMACVVSSTATTIITSQWKPVLNYTIYNSRSV